MRFVPVAVLACALFSSVGFGSVVVTDEDTLNTNNIAAGPQSVSVDGVTATFSTPPGVVTMSVDEDGIYLDDFGEILHVTFDADVLITGYSIGFSDSPISGNVEFYVDGGTSYFEPGVAVGSYTLATPLTVNVGSVLTINGNMDNTSQLKSLTFVVPEPSSALLVLGGLLGTGVVGRSVRRR
jgi:hypothetical protein